MTNAYRALGVAPNADLGQLRLAYKEAARRVAEEEKLRGAILVAETTGGGDAANHLPGKKP